MGFIEIHSHILPFVDDGVGSKDDCVRMLDAYADAGFDRVVTTVHLYNPQVATRIQNIRPMYAWAAEEARSRNIQLLLGSETYVGGTGTPRVLPFLNRFVLLEVDVVSEPLFLLNHAFALLKRGYSVILAHIERYRWFDEQSSVAKKLREMGVYFQCNADGLESGNANTWLDAGMVDVIAGDNHGDAGMPARLAALFHTYPDILGRMESLFRDPSEI